MQGIYAIENITSFRLYIGSSVNIKKRFSEHRWMLRANRHHNAPLQADFNIVGETGFNFFVVYDATGLDDYDILIELERSYVLSQPKGLVYNTAWVGRNFMYGRKHTRDTRDKISKALTKITDKAIRTRTTKDIDWKAESLSFWRLVKEIECTQ